MKKYIKKIKPLKRIYDGYIATKYFNLKYFKILKWLFSSNEDTNYTYGLTKKNIDELNKILEIVFPEVPFLKIKSYLNEIINDEELKVYISKKISNSKFKNVSDKQIYFSRRIGWYAFVRIIKPKIIVETGVDKGMGSVVLVRALQMNEKENFSGRYFGTDINPEAGFLFDDEFRQYGEILYGDSIKTLENFSHKIDLFINDSDHSKVYEYNEYLAIKNKLSENGIILGDNSNSTDSLLNFSVVENRSFILFRENPLNHWYPGAGIGISYSKK
jgi:hypothetical protein